MKLFRVSCIGLLILCLAIIPVYSKSDQGQGQGQDNQGQGHGNRDRGSSSQNQNNQGNSSNTPSANRAADPEARRHNIEKERNQANLRANRPTEQNKGRNTEHALVKGKGVAKIEHAKWSHNPKDERGQGNMGKVDMRAPYGFDKDSGREGQDRGRLIRIDLSDIVSADFNIVDEALHQKYRLLEKLRALAELYPNDPYYANQVIALEEWIDTYIANLVRVRIGTNYSTDLDALRYTLTFTPPEEWEGKTLFISTTLINLYDYDYVDYQWYFSPTDPYVAYRTDELFTVHYDAGQVIMEETQQIVLGADETFSYSLDPSCNLAGRNQTENAYDKNGLYAEFAVTISDEEGNSYTIPYDKELYIYRYRCPYGRVYNAKTGESIVGAKVTVFYKDGSIVALDKASNPTAHNPQITDATGRYGFKLEINKKYYITAIVPGYKDFKSGIFTEKWHVLREDIALTPLETMK